MSLWTHLVELKQLKSKVYLRCSEESPELEMEFQSPNLNCLCLPPVSHDKEWTAWAEEQEVLEAEAGEVEEEVVRELR